MAKFKDIPPVELAQETADALAEVKGMDITLLDLSGLSSFSDYFVIATAESHVQMQALADRVRKIMSKKGVKPIHAEGRDSKSWILLDYGTVIVHIFSKKARAYYSIEDFWGDAKIFHWSEENNEFSEEQKIRAVY